MVRCTASRLRPFGGEQLERAVGARDVKRAYLGHHVGGDENDDAVEARLCETGSAMTSRSRRSNSRGPPGARIKNLSLISSQILGFETSENSGPACETTSRIGKCALIGKRTKTKGSERLVILVALGRRRPLRESHPERGELLIFSRWEFCVKRTLKTRYIKSLR